jgi:reductive dehalogenase
MKREKNKIARRDFFGLMAGSAGALAVGAASSKSSGNAVPDLQGDPPAPRTLPAWVREVDKPTYTKDIVGPIVKCDQRLHFNNSYRLRPGDGYYERIMAEYPELLRFWEALAPERVDERVKAERKGISMPAYLAAKINSWGAVWLAHPDAVTPKISPKQIPIDDPALMSTRIKEMARLMGAADVKIGPLNQDWIYSIRAGDPGITGVYPDYWGSPNVLTHKSAIVFALLLDTEYITDGDGPAANARTGWAYTQGAMIAAIISQYIAKLGYPVRAHTMADGQTPIVPLAIDAGMGELGRHGFCVHPTLGSHFRLAAVTTDLPLVHDKPIDFGLQNFCESCKICAEACPAGAIEKGPKREPKDLATDGPRAKGVKKWLQSGIRCRTYWANNGLSCYICMTACPWSKPENWLHKSVRPFAALGGKPAGAALAQMERTFYGTYTRKKDPPCWTK